MTRLQRLVKIVKEEQAVVASGGTKADTEALCRHQDRLLTFVNRTHQTVPFELFYIPPRTKMLGGKKFILVSQVHDEFNYVEEACQKK